MKLLIDMQGVQTASRHRGIGRYTRATTIECLKLARERVDVSILFNAALDGIDETMQDLAALAINAPRRAYGPLRGTSSDNVANDARREAAEIVYAHALDTSGADVVWFTSIVEGFADDALIPASLPRQLTVATLYDLIPLHDAEHMGASRARDWYMRRVEALRKCDLLLAISDWVRDDAITRLRLDPSRVVTIGAGVDPMFHPPGDSTTDAAVLHGKFGIRKPYVLYNGGTDERKNVDALFPAFAALPPAVRAGHQLVIVGRLDEPTRHRFGQGARASGLSKDEVLFPGFVSDEDLVRLYQQCALFVFPSAREGFGLPPLEAMACGAPVIVNHATSLPEVVGDPSATFDARDPTSITDAMRDILAQPSRASELRAAGLQRAAMFTWRETASRALTAIESAWRQRGYPRLVCEPTWAAIDALPSGLPESDVQVPVYLMDQANAARLLPGLRTWPGLVEWQGPYPPSSAMSGFDRYRAGGWKGVVTPNSVEWSDLIRAEAIAATHVTIRPGLDARRAWFMTQAGHTRVRQRAVEDVLAATVASRLDDVDLARTADALDRLNHGGCERWLVDVTHISRHDLSTGVQRVVRSILYEWLRNPPDNVRVEPVAFREGRFHHADEYTARLLGVPLPEGLADEPVAISGGEAFIGLDWAMESLPSSAALLRTWRRAGVSMHFVVNDLLPLTLPDAFHAQTRDAFTRWLGLVAGLSDAIHCISQSTADDMVHWLHTVMPSANPTVFVFPLGVAPPRATEAAKLEGALADALAARPSLLMVGTIEPRKGHSQALQALELLWTADANVNLVIVGKRGWLVNEVIQGLETHPELGSRLFWLEGCPDAVLEALYNACTALLVPSLGEGFGLPVIEAAQHGKPVVARALKVFREVAGDYPSYFDATTPAALATFLARWLADRPVAKPPFMIPGWDIAARVLAANIRVARNPLREPFSA